MSDAGPPAVAFDVKRFVILVLAAGLLLGAFLFRSRFFNSIGRLQSAVSSDDIQLVLSRRFLETYQDRVTIRATFTVDEAMESPYPAMSDGDLHFAGRAPEVALPVVGEIANAAQEPEAVALLQRAESLRATLPLSGPWRLWPEHPVKSRQSQGRSVPTPTSANPEHAFEIHPVMQLPGISLLRSFHPVDGYRPPSASQAFGEWQRAQCELRARPDSVVLLTKTGFKNDVRFILQLGETPQRVVEDGRFVTASALDPDGTVLVTGLRAVFAKDTPPEVAVRALPAGARLRVWGLPRVSLAELVRRLNSASGSRVTLRGSLPYEIVVLGVYPDMK